MILPTSFSVYLLVALESLIPTSTAQAIDSSQLVGTWTSKSGKVLTGPGFYNPVNETLSEPSLTGISFSFTADGHYEQALYKAISNPTTPSCTSAIMQWSHGTYTLGMNTTLNKSNLTLNPIAVDGRQLLSSPCDQKTTVISRWNVPQFFSEVEVLLDTYNQKYRLNLFEWDGTPMNPMWIAMKPPQMLPTSTLNPTSNVTATGAMQTATAKIKRALNLRTNVKQSSRQVLGGRSWLDSDMLFWFGIAMTALGGVLVISC